MPPGCLRFKAFSMHCVSHIQHGLWVRSATRQLAYPQLAPGREQAEHLEKGRVEALCLADVSGVYDTYPGGPETSLADGMPEPGERSGRAHSCHGLRDRAPGLCLYQFDGADAPLYLGPPGVDPRPSLPWSDRVEYRHLIPAQRRSQSRLWRAPGTRCAL